MNQSAAEPKRELQLPCSINNFIKVVESERPHVFRFLLASMRDVDLAETLTQECFLKAYRHWADFRGDSHVTTWLIQIAINLQREYWRNQKARFWRQAYKEGVDAQEVEKWLPSRESSPEARVMARERVRHIWEIVKTFSKKRRTVFLLRYVEELTLREIVQATGMREGSVKSNLFHATNRIRAELKARDTSRSCLAQISVG